MKKYIIIILLFANCNLFAQKVDQLIDLKQGFCGAEAPSEEILKKQNHYGNNAYLLELLVERGIEGLDKANEQLSNLKSKNYTSEDIMKLSSSLYFAPGYVNKVIPVKAWIHRDGNGAGGTTAQDVEDAINRLNEKFAGPNNTSIQFYLKCDIGFVDNDSYYDVSFLNASTRNSLWGANRDSNALNIHFTSGTDFSHYGAFPGDQYPYSVIMNINAGTTGVNEAVAHEVGHTLFLLHTHHAKGIYFSKNGYSQIPKCEQETADHSPTQGLFCHSTGWLKCEVNGDKLCDTAADPLLSDYGSMIGCTLLTII